eukprot:EC692243.1.p4 GENE.EC692243.1~~EC692243.1.p4  ORF type:complete len:106 (-),score=19.41 EC692243.1:191-508(-)
MLREDGQQRRFFGLRCRPSVDSGALTGGKRHAVTKNHEEILDLRVGTLVAASQQVKPGPTQVQQSGCLEGGQAEVAGVHAGSGTAAAVVAGGVAGGRVLCVLVHR